MCGFLSPKVPQVDEGAAKARAVAEQAARDKQAAVDAEVSKQARGKARGRASLFSTKTGSRGVSGSLDNKKNSLF